MTEKDIKLKATFIYIKYEIEKLAEQFNLSPEQLRQLELNIQKKMEVT